MPSFATKLEKILHERSINQSALAKKIGVDKSLMNKWVKGRHVPSARFMTKIARELGMTEQEIFFDPDFSHLD
ncbi:MAG: helix-turn-helix transcriptional regulator [Actinomycetota bacterium]|nr:helix-turn-helix transcriptional regulator [Actinomycetota bacterium]